MRIIWTCSLWRSVSSLAPIADQGALAEYINSMNVDRNDPKNDIVNLELIDPEKSRLYPRNKDAWTLAANQIIKAATGWD